MSTRYICSVLLILFHLATISKVAQAQESSATPRASVVYERNDVMVYEKISQILDSIINGSKINAETTQKIRTEAIQGINAEAPQTIPSKAAQMMMVAARERMGTPYVAGTLEFEPEQLIINIHQTDCILFVESCLCLALNSLDETPSFDNFCRLIREMRYRRGIVSSYVDRIHYTSEWIMQNLAKGILSEITTELGGESIEQHFNFMSRHPQSYKQLANSPAMVNEIALVETNLENRDYYMIAKDNVTEQFTNELQDGDIICLVSPVEGLDIAHVGFACRREDGRMGFLHASSKEMRVVLDTLSLSDYLGRGKNLGIRVLRLF